MKLKKGYLVIVFLVFAIALLLYVSFSTQIVFHDTPEYYSVTKDLAGYGNIGVYSTHSFVYSFFMVPFVKLFPGFIAIKIVNMVWLLLDTLLILFFFKDRRVFFLWIFSPLVWLVSPQYSPILPASFFLILMYLTFVRWESTNKRYYFVVSALSGGMTFALYEPSVVLLVFFMLSFFYKKSLLVSILFLLLMFPAFALRLAVDYYLTGFPLYSFVRYFGTNLAVVLGFNQGTKGFLHGFASIDTLYSLFMIAPLLFLFFKVDFSKNKRLLLFVLLSSLFFFLRSGIVKYFLLIAPFIFLILSGVMTKKLLVINSILSVIIIIIFSQSYFAADYVKLASEDMNSISTDFPAAHYIDAADAALYTWGGGYRFYGIYEYLNAAANKTYYSDYDIVVGNKRVYLYQILELKADLEPNYGDDISTSPLLMKKGVAPLEGFNLQKCYQYVCVYKK